MMGAKRAVVVGLVLLVTVTGVVSATSVVSVDGDTVPAVEEFQTGTDPFAADTDGDGLPDGAEASDGVLSAADPLWTDVFVEIDYVDGHRPSEAALERVQKAYASAPVGNPDSSTGIDLHVVVNESVPADGRVSTGDLERRMSDHFDREDRGYRYAIAGDPFDDWAYINTNMTTPTVELPEDAP